MSQPELLDSRAIERLLSHFEQHPGDECVACHRIIPKKKGDDRIGSQRSVVSIHEPSGLEGTLEQLMIANVSKYREQWPLEFATMRNGIGLEVVGGRSWKFHVAHFALYATLMVPGLEPDSGE